MFISSADHNSFGSLQQKKIQKIIPMIIIKRNNTASILLLLSSSFLGGGTDAAAIGTQRKLQEPPLLQVTFPLQNCNGDCDDDSHCSGNLICFQRSGTEAVPGCSGSAPSGIDFCAERATENTVWLKGDNGSPAANFPLGLCEGDCDSDADCQTGLIW
jgi:hypothetical protein